MGGTWKADCGMGLRRDWGGEKPRPSIRSLSNASCAEEEEDEEEEEEEDEDEEDEDDDEAREGGKETEFCGGEPTSLRGRCSTNETLGSIG